MNRLCLIIDIFETFNEPKDWNYYLRSQIAIEIKVIVLKIKDIRKVHQFQLTTISTCGSLEVCEIGKFVYCHLAGQRQCIELSSYVLN